MNRCGGDPKFETECSSLFQFISSGYIFYSKYQMFRLWILFLNMSTNLGVLGLLCKNFRDDDIV